VWVRAAALTAVGSDGKAGRTNAAGTEHYFKKSSITISGLSGDCYIKFDARKTKWSSSPGVYSTYVSGTGDFDGDDDLDDYNHGWKKTTSTSVTYSDLPDGYFFFTSSCTSPYSTSEDLQFAVGAYSQGSRTGENPRVTHKGGTSSIESVAYAHKGGWRNLTRCQASS
jgi:hypothetical protein